MEDDLRAFRLGREVALDPEKFQREIQPKKLTAAELIEAKAELLSDRSFTGKQEARAYKKIIENALGKNLPRAEWEGAVPVVSLFTPESERPKTANGGGSRRRHSLLRRR